MNRLAVTPAGWGLAHRRLWLWAGTLFPALTLGFLPGLARAFEYDREGISRGELWRLWTAHWTHWSADHLLWNLATVGLLLAVALHRRGTRGGRRLLAGMALAATAIPAAAWVLLPEMSRYRGLSGLASALFTFVAADLLVQALRRRRANGGEVLPIAVAGLAVAAFHGKLLWEMTAGTALFADSATAGFSPVPLAHAVGGLAGLVSRWAPSRGWRRFQRALRRALAAGAQTARSESAVRLGAIGGCALLAVGCASSALPPKLSPAQAASLAGPPIPARVAVETFADPVYSDRLTEALRSTGLFTAVGSPDQLPNAELIARVERRIHGTAVFPLWTVLTAGVVPTTVEEEHGNAFSLRSANGNAPALAIESTYRGGSTLGWLALLKAASPRHCLCDPRRSERYLARLAADLAARRDEILALLAEPGS